MASLYRKPVFVNDPKSGQKTKILSAKWWGQYIDASGRLRRKPLATDKTAAMAMLNALVKTVEREKAGLITPVDRQSQRPLQDHLKDFKKYKTNRGISKRQIDEALRQLTRIVAECKWTRLNDISASQLLEFLGKLKQDGRGVQTCNHYLQAAKQFTRWLVRDQRFAVDPLTHLSKQNTAVDRRHDRRPLSMDEFQRVLAAAQNGKQVEGIAEPDRRLLYMLAGWTGFRRGELGSLTKSSFQFTAEPPTVTVAANYSKRRRQDSQILHPDLVRELELWLETKPKLEPKDLLFPISDSVPGGTQRKTSKMIRRDLAQARKTWLKEAADDAEHKLREKSDFLLSKNHDGLFADFHAIRHFFITNLERAGISPKMAQTLARHSDIRLTLGVYTHVGVKECYLAIGNLPSPVGKVG